MPDDLAALNKLAITSAQRYMGGFALGTVLFTIVVLLLFVANLWLAAQEVLPLWVSFVAHAALTYMAYTPVHEAAHGNIHGRHTRLKWLNDLCGYLCAQVVFNPYSTHTVEHFTHHRHTNEADKDPDFIVKKMGDGPVSFFTAAALAMWTQLTFLFQGHWEKASLREKLTYWAEVGTATAWRVVLLIQLPHPVGLALLVGAYAVAVLFTLYWFAYRPHHPYEDAARYRNTNSLIVPGWMRPLEWFWLGQNLHSIHHAFPRVPFYKYHALFREIEPIMRAHGGSVIGMFDRLPVPATMAKMTSQA